MSYSEIIRETLRFLFLPENKEKDPYHYRMDFLAHIYIGWLYNLKPTTSLLIFYNIPPTDISVKPDRNELETLKWADRDSMILKEFIKDLHEEISTQQGGNRRVKRWKTELGDFLGYNTGDINKSLLRYGKYKSNVSDFSFLSAFIGLKMLVTEWEIKQHELPMIAAISNGFISKNGEKFSYGSMMEQRLLVTFEEWMNMLFKVSKNYKETGTYSLKNKTQDA